MYLVQKQLLFRIMFMLSLSSLPTQQVDAQSILMSPESVSQALIESNKKNYLEKLNTSVSFVSLVKELEASTELSQVSRENLLFEIAKTLKNDATENSIKALNLIRTLKPKIKTYLSDGNHQQIIIAFPFSSAATASLNHIRTLKLAEVLLTQLEHADYTALEMSNEFFEDKNTQLNSLRRIASQLSQQQAQLFVDWSIDRKDVFAESKLVMAIRAKDKNNIVSLLKTNQSIPLQHYLSSIVSLWEKAQQISVIEIISENRKYASQAIYHVTKLDLPEDEKHTFWLNQLAEPDTGASAAHCLALSINDDLIERLVEISQENQNSISQVRAVLALRLSQHPYAKQKLMELSNSDELSVSLIKELSK